MSWLYSRALVEEYSAESCSGGEPSAPSNTTNTPAMYLSQGKTTEASNLSRYGMMCEPLTAYHGAELLTSYLAGFPARTLAVQAMAPGLMENEVVFGAKWPGSLAKYDLDTASWKTAQCLLLGGLESFSGTWPRWGIMQDGAFWELAMPGYITSVKESGLLPTPQKIDGDFYQMKIKTAAREGHQVQLTTEAIKLNSTRFPLPCLGEIVMGWPEGWTRSDGEELEMGKFRQWLDLHGIS